jgi:O-methyltransferase involved in polyketide biosynthesis
MEPDAIKFEVGEIQQILILPLWARAKESEKDNPILMDIAAREIISRIDYDFSPIEANREFAENQQIQWALRAYHFNRKINQFIRVNDKATVINIGAGLDTTFRRIDDGKVRWAKIELPDVAALRNRIIPDNDRERTIGKSVFDFSWTDDIEMLTTDRKIMIMAAGVFFYFPAAGMKILMPTLSEAYPGSELVFDVLSSWIWVTLINWAIMSKSGMGSSVRLRWYLRKAASLKRWVPSVKIIDEYSIFSRIPHNEEWDKKKIRDMKIGNFLNVYKMVYVKL